MKRSITLAVLALCAATTAGARPQRDSAWTDGRITIDGSAADWSSGLSTLEGSNVSVGVRNDGDALYICLSMDRPMEQMPVMSNGLTVWFDPDGGSDRTIGVRFPLGLRNTDHARLPEADRTRDKFREMFKATLKEMEILGPDKDDRREVGHGELAGLDAAVDFAGDVMVYELRIPLHTGAGIPFGIDVRKDKIGMRVESPRPERPEGMRRDGPGGGGWGGGFSGFQEGAGGDRPGGGFGGGPGGFGGRRGGRPEPLNLELEIRLATGPGN